MKRGLVGPFRTISVPVAIADLTSRRFGMLVARGYIGIAPVGDDHLWLCDCDCGNIAVGRAKNLQRKGKQTHCGCVVREKNRRLNTKHGQGSPKSRTTEYKTWLSMRERCLNSKHHGFASYGGRGITICRRWDEGEGGRSGFECFFSDMGEKPSPSHSIDRIDNDGNYEPTNCRWATSSQQISNRRNSVTVIIDGEVRKLTDICKRRDLDIRVVRQRLSRGVAVDEALQPTNLGWRSA